MLFVEMLEFIGRLGNLVYKDRDDLSLSDKIDNILDKLLNQIG